MPKRVDAIAIDERDGAGRGNVEITIEEDSADCIAGTEFGFDSRGRLSSAGTAGNGDEAHRIEDVREARDCLGSETRK